MSALDGPAGFLRCVIVEGCVDRFCGRPFERNPYSPQLAPGHWEAWEFGWLDADLLLRDRGQTEARRWLREAS